MNTKQDYDSIKKDREELEKKTTDKLASKENTAVSQQEILEKLVSDEDISNMDCSLENIIAIEIKTRQVFKEIKKIMASNGRKLDLLLEKVQGILNIMKADRLKRAATNSIITRQVKQLKDHE